MTTPAENTALQGGPALEAPARHDGTHSADVIAPPPGLPPAVETAARWVAGHPHVVLPAVAAAVVYYFSPGGQWVVPPIFAALAALFTWAVVMRFRYREKFRSRKTRGGQVQVHFPAASRTEFPPADLPVQPEWVLGTRPAAPVTPFAAQRQEEDERAPLPDTEAVLRAANKLITGLRPGPERITAGVPGDVRVRWDDESSARDIDPARIDKMKIILKKFRSAAADADLLHRLPQLLLIADTGGVIELFGDWGCGRTGVVITTPAAV